MISSIRLLIKHKFYLFFSLSHFEKQTNRQAHTPLFFVCLYLVLLFIIYLFPLRINLERVVPKQHAHGLSTVGQISDLALSFTMQT